jgi:hypothetical protein
MHIAALASSQRFSVVWFRLPHLLWLKQCLMVAGSVTITVNLVTMLFQDSPGVE